MRDDRTIFIRMDWCETLTFACIHTVTLETELLMDYYLVPGAEWSLIKKGETVQIIGKAKDNGWYRCMALRESQVKLDRAPFQFMIRSIISQPTLGVDMMGAGQSGITPEMIEEEYTQREDDDDSFSFSKDGPAEVIDMWQ